MNSIHKHITQTHLTGCRAPIKSIVILCLGLLMFIHESSFAQVINNTGGAVLTVPSGNVITADIITNDNTPSIIDNQGTINVTTLTNNGTMQGSGIYNVTGIFTNTGTFTPGTSTFEFTSGGAQTIPAINFYHLTLGNAGTKTFAGNTGITGDYTVSGSAVPDAVTNSTTITFNGSGAQQIAGSVATTFYNLTLNNAAGLTLNTSASIVSNTLTLTSGTFAVGANSMTLNGPAIAGTPSNLSTTSSSSLTFGGSSGGVTVPSSVAALSNLTINNSSGVSMAGSTAIDGTLTLTSGAFTVGANTLTLNGPAIAGTPANLTTSASSSLIFAGSSSGITIPSSVAALNNLTVNNTNGVTMSSTIAVNGTMTLTAGQLSAGTNNITMAGTNWTNNGGSFDGGSGTVTFSGASGSVDGTTSTAFNDIVVANNASWTIYVSTSAATLSIATGANNSTLTINGSNALTVSGAVTLNASATNGINKTIAVGAGSLTAASVSMTTSGNNARDCILSLSTGTITISGNLSMASAFARHHIDISGAGTINIGGAVDNGAGAVGGGFTTPPAGSTINLNGSSTQTVFLYGGATALGIVKINNTAGVTTSAAMTLTDLIIGDVTSNSVANLNATTINGALTITSGTLNSNNTLTVAGTTNILGTLNIASASGTKSFVDVNLNANSILSFSVVETAALTGSLTMDNNSVISGSALDIITVADDLNIIGTGVTIGQSTLTVTDSTIVTGAIDFNHATGVKTLIGPVMIAGGASWSATGNGAFTLRNGLNFNGTSFSSGTGTYTFNTNSQTIGGTGSVSFSGAVTITGAIVIDVATTTSFNGSVTGSVGGSTLRIGTGLTVNFLGAATLATGTLDLTTNTPNTVIYSAVGPSPSQTVKGTTYYNLEINGDDNTKTLNANTTVNNQLTVTAGTLSLSTFNLIMGGTAPIVLNDSLLVTSATGTRTFNSITIGATGTFSCSAAETFSVLGDWTNNGGTVTPGTSIVSFDGAGAQAINGTAASQTFYSLIINNSVGTVATGGSTTDLNIDGVFTLTLGSFTAPTTMSVAGNWSEATGTTFTPGSGTITFDGASAQVLGTTATKTFNNVVINKTAGQTLTTGGSTTTITINGTLTQTLGNFTPPATLNVSGITTLTTGTFSVGAGTKTLSDDVNINSTAVLTVSNAASIVNIGGDLTMDGTGSITGTATGTITVTGDLIVNGTNNGIGQSTFSVNGTTTVNGTMGITNATGVKSLVDLNMTSGSLLTFSAAGTMNISGSVSMGNSSSISGSATGVLSVTDNLNISGTGVTIGRATITVTDTTLITGDVDFNSVTGTKTFIGPVTISVSGSWASSGNGAFVLRGGLTHDGTSFSSGTGLYTLNTNPQTIDGSSQLTFANLTITGVTVTNNNTDVNGLTITTALAGTGGLTNAANRLLNIVGTSAITTLTATANLNTVIYNGAAQTIKGTTYHHLQITTAGIKTLGAATVVNGDVTVTNGTLALSTLAFTVSGTTDVNGAMTSAATAVKSFADLNLNANATLTFSAAATFNVGGNLTMGNSSSITGTNTGVITVTDNLNITGTGVIIGRSTITVTDTTLITGDVDFNNATGIKTFNGPVIISTGASWSSTANSAFTLANGLTHNGTSFSSGAGTYTFNTNNQDINSTSSLTFGGVVAITGAVNINNYTSITLSGNLTGSVSGSTWTNQSGSTLNINAAFLATGTLNASASPNTVNYAGGIQTVKGATYHHLQLTAAGIKTAEAAISVNGNLTLSGSASLDDAGFQIDGNASGAFSLGSGSILTLGSAVAATFFPTNFINANISLDAASEVIYNSDQAQTISVVPTYGNLTLTSTANVTKTISATLTTNGDITVNTNNNLNITGAGDVTVGGNFNLTGTLTNAGILTIGP